MKFLIAFLIGLTMCTVATAQSRQYETRDGIAFELSQDWSVRTIVFTTKWAAFTAEQRGSGDEIQATLKLLLEPHHDPVSNTQENFAQIINNDGGRRAVIDYLKNDHGLSVTRELLEEPEIVLAELVYADVGYYNGWFCSQIGFTVKAFSEKSGPVNSLFTEYSCPDGAKTLVLRGMMNEDFVAENEQELALDQARFFESLDTSNASWK